eukprot:9571158-Alexandrium_andersonii.AAC.1
MLALAPPGLASIVTKLQTRPSRCARGLANLARLLVAQAAASHSCSALVQDAKPGSFVEVLSLIHI